jgi:hypothetical protein
VPPRSPPVGGTTDDRSDPVDSGARSVTAITAGAYHNLVITRED